VDGQRMASLELGLSLVFDVKALMLLISGGRLIAIRSGHCGITASLAVQGTDLLTRQAHLELPGVISLRRGIRLLPADAYPARADLPGEHAMSEDQASDSPVGKEAPSVPWWQSTRNLRRDELNA
jgi:hypothetical protein